MTGAKILTPTKCRLCGYVFPPELFQSATLLLDNPQAKAQQVQQAMMPLVEHLSKFHNEGLALSPGAGRTTVSQNKSYMSMIELQAATYRGLLVMMAFDVSDELIDKQRDYLRWQIHQQTMRARVSDERIRERAISFCNTADFSSIDDLVKLLTEMRDSLEERDRYPQS